MFREVVDELIECSDAELIERIEANELERRRLDGELSAALAVAKSRALHRNEGHRTMASFCRERLNWSTAEARRRLGLSRAVDALPGFGDAWVAGRFGMSQAVKLSMANGNPRVAEQLPRFAPKLLKNAEQMPYADFAATVDHVVAQADEDGAHDDRDLATEGRTARAVDVAGTLDLKAVGGDGLVTAEVIEILERFTTLEYRKDVAANRERFGDEAGRHPLPRTDAQRRYDAIVAIFRAAATVGDVGTAAEPLVNIVIDARTWGRLLIEAGLSTSTDLGGRAIDPFTGLAVDEAGDLLGEFDTSDIDDRRCETANGVGLHPHDVLRAALAGHVRRVVVDSERVVIDLGRRQRLFTGPARQAAKLLISRCERSGCDLPADWCDVDHDAEWIADVGRTDQRNGRILCRSDNNDKHRRRWRTRRALNGSSYTVREDGTIVMPVGARPPDFASSDDDDDDWDESPEQLARQVAIIRNRVADLRRPAA